MQAPQDCLKHMHGPYYFGFLTRYYRAALSIFPHTLCAIFVQETDDKFIGNHIFN